MAFFQLLWEPPTRGGSSSLRSAGNLNLKVEARKSGLSLVPCEVEHAHLEYIFHKLPKIVATSCNNVTQPPCLCKNFHNAQSGLPPLTSIMPVVRDSIDPRVSWTAMTVRCCRCPFTGILSWPESETATKQNRQQGP